MKIEAEIENTYDKNSFFILLPALLLVFEKGKFSIQFGFLAWALEISFTRSEEKKGKQI